MKKDNVKLGQTYVCKVSGSVVPVRLDRESPHGEWVGVNMTTRKEVREESAQHLRGLWPKKTMAMLLLTCLAVFPGCRKTERLVSATAADDVIDSVSTIAIDRKGQELCLVMERRNQLPARVDLGSPASLGTVMILVRMVDSLVLVANDDIVLGGYNCKSGEYWGDRKYEGLPHLTMTDACNGGFQKLVGQKIGPKGTVPSGHPLYRP